MGKNQINVSTGEIAVGFPGDVLYSQGIGSCVVVCMYDVKNCIAGLAHVMLPGGTQEQVCRSDYRYAENAVRETVARMEGVGADKKSIHAVVTGGGNVLKHEYDTVCAANVESVGEVLHRLAIPLRAEATGGYLRRKVSFDTTTGEVICAQSDMADSLLYRFER